MGQQNPYVGRALELELIRVRAEAAAVRLEARAAEIELLLISHATAGVATAGVAAAESDEPADSAALTGPWEGIAVRRQPGQRAPAEQATGEGCAGGLDDGPRSAAAAEPSPGVRLDAAEALVMAIRQLVSAHPQQRAATNPQPEDDQPAPQDRDGWQTRLETLRRRSCEDRHPAPQASPVAASPVAASPVAASPVAASPVAASPVTASPVAAALTAELPPQLAAEHRCAATTGPTFADPPAASGDGGAAAPLGEARLLRFDEPAESTGRPQLRQRRMAEQSGPSAAAGIVASLIGEAEPGGVSDLPAADGSMIAGSGAMDAKPLRGDRSAATPASGAAAEMAASIAPVRSGSQPGRSIAAPLGNLPAGAICAQPQDAMPRRRRLRPGGWLASTLAHLVVLVLLALMTLSAQKPRDQLAFSASASEASQEVMETFTIETSESVPEEAQAQPTETALEISAVGTLPVAEVSLDLAATPLGIAADLFSTRAGSMSTLAEASAKSDSPTKVQFAGVDGGGNHFVYLVDSSNSMRNFNEARIELLRSIDSLQADQRFYVAFYDANPDFMRLADADTDQPTSVLATPANKLALRRWAMTIQQERGKSPIDVLPFAFGLRADVVFLLSDGEFSARTEQVIGEHNRRSNLFGEQGPISIIHTIRYPGYSAEEARSAEVQMRRIAAENGGQYRNVVIP